MIRQLRIKFIVINMSIVTILLSIMLSSVYHITKSNLEMESINMMRNIAQRPYELTMPNQLGTDIRLPYFMIQFGLRGELLAIGGYYDLSNRDFLQELVDAAYASHKNVNVIEKYNLRYLRIQTPVNQYLVFSDISSEKATLKNMMESCLTIGILSFILFLIASIQLSKWAVKPVDEAWQQQRQFIADASHELKTPLTVILTNAELALANDSEQEERQKFLASIVTMVHQMRCLIEKLLELARIDQMKLPCKHTAVDFSGATNDAILPFEPMFFEKGLKLVTQIEPDIRVEGDRQQLCQIVEILLDNAQKYSRENGTAWVVLARSGRNRCTLSVANEGKEIPQSELKNIFKRFYQANEARNTGSFGLGLSIAEAIVVQHHGKIWAESKNGISRFFVELPTA